jgi:alkylresorcinol/alkylpyrone synthase
MPTLTATMPRPRRTRTRRRLAALSPAIVGTGTALAKYRYRQTELAATVQAALPEGMLRNGKLQRFFETVQVEERHFVLPVERILSLGGFKERNDIYIEAALNLGEEALRKALADAGIEARDVAMLATTSVTGIAVPSLDARLMNRIDFSPNLVRLPLFGLGCLGGAAGVARVAEWLRGNPDKCAVLLSVETCSLAFQRSPDIGNLVSVGLFGDGAVAVVLAGAKHPLATGRPFGTRARVLGSLSTFFPNSERVMGWDIGDNGFTPVLSADVPDIVREHAPKAVDALLAKFKLPRAKVHRWVMHPGGPKVIDAMQESLGIAPAALAPPRRHLARVGNLSSASVLFILDEHRRCFSASKEQGPYGVMMALGPAFCAEVLLLRFEDDARFGRIA